jgi:predicted transcriptional regulator
MTQVEIARELGISQPAVCKHLRRARLKRLGFSTRCDTVDPAVIDETKIKATL